MIRWRRKQEEQRGFSLVLTLVLVAMLAVTGAMVIDTVELQSRIMGINALVRDARQASENAAFEVINDQDLPSMLPNFSSAKLESDYTVSSGSLIGASATAFQRSSEYTGRIQLLRSIPVFESSANAIRAFVYEVEVDATIGDDHASNGLRYETLKVFSLRAGTLVPSKHAR